MLVPAGTVPEEVKINGAAAEFRDETVGKSHYAVLENVPSGAEVEIRCR